MSQPQLNPTKWERGQPKKIALVLGGGGSLGAYEAGAVTELIYALETFNAALLARGDKELFEIDVVVGASAGGMTAALLSRIMLYDVTSRKNLFAAWVQDIQMKDLAPQDNGNQATDQANAFLSNAPIKNIAAKYLVSPPIQRLHPASFAPNPITGELHLGLTLSNMNGFDYTLATTSVRQPPPYPPIITRFADAAYYPINSKTLPALDWSAIADSAEACGNFPLAFQPHALRRDKSDYSDGPLQVTTLKWPADLTFIDGGMFDNEPLGKAINLATTHDPNGMPEPGRLFLTIHPNITHSDHSDTISPQSGLWTQMGRLLDMLVTENSVADWIEASKVNVRTDWRNNFANRLADIVMSTTMSADAGQELTTSLTALATQIAAAEMPNDTLGYLTNALRFVGAQQPDAWQRLKEHPIRAKVFELVLFILDHVADLQQKSKLWFEVIGHDPVLSLAGEQLTGFAGFCNRDWREYDFRRGRFDAWKVLSGWGCVEEGQAGWNGQWWNGPKLKGQSDSTKAILGVYEQEPLPTQSTPGPKVTATDSDYYTDVAYWQQRTAVQKFPLVSFDDVDKDTQEAIKNRVLNRVKGLLGLSGITGWIAGKFISSKVNALLNQLGNEGGAREADPNGALTA